MAAQPPRISAPNGDRPYWFEPVPARFSGPGPMALRRRPITRSQGAKGRAGRWLGTTLVIGTEEFRARLPRGAFGAVAQEGMSPSGIPPDPIAQEPDRTAISGPPRASGGASARVGERRSRLRSRESPNAQTALRTSPKGLAVEQRQTSLFPTRAGLSEGWPRFFEPAMAAAAEEDKEACRQSHRGRPERRCSCMPIYFSQRRPAKVDFFFLPTIRRTWTRTDKCWGWCGQVQLVRT